MNYDEQINELVTAIKIDKAIIQPWRNKAVARLEEAQAFVRMGKTSTRIVDEAAYFRTPEGAGIQPVRTNGCICPEGALDSLCPVHGQ